MENKKPSNTNNNDSFSRIINFLMANNVKVNQEDHEMISQAIDKMPKACFEGMEKVGDMSEENRQQIAEIMYKYLKSKSYD